jgi:cytochrome d ubiquinol oxidase subunit II
MSLEVVAAGVLMFGLIAYAVFGGADFGGGVWTALAFGPRAREQRDAIFRAMGPVWETNHVWLILVLVTLWTAFPPAFAHIFTALLVPLVIALVGIIFRGAAFGFRHFGEGTLQRLPATGAVFAVASMLTPIALGVAVGAIAGGHISIAAGRVESGLYAPWLRAFPLICGGIGLAMCAVLTAFFMTTRTSGELREDFRIRGIAASLVLGALTTAAIPVAHWDAPAFADRIARPATLALMSAAVLAGISSMFVLWHRWYRLAPPIAAITVALVVGAWGAAQYPYLVLPGETLAQAAATRGTLVAFLAILPIGAVVLVPSLALLFWTFRGETDQPPAHRIRDN